MDSMKIPASIRIEVPEEFGSVYTNEDGSRQYVERRQQVGRSMIRALEALDALFTEEEQFEKACEIYKSIFTDWDLADSQTGPLPKPWQNAKAFEALMDMDMRLTLWVIGLVFTSMARLLDIQSSDEDIKN